MPEPDPIPKAPSKSVEIVKEAESYFVRYAAVVVKNVVGYLLMLAALVLGGFFPIPIGTPMFLIGFAMITLPGKRKLTSGALRGITIKVNSRAAHLWRLAGALLLPPAFVWLLALQRYPIVHPSKMTLGRLCFLYVVTIVAAWILMWIFLLALNLVISILPRIRRKVRPWLRDHGVNLLPPRRKPRPIGGSKHAASDDESIVEFGDYKSMRRTPRT
jgi:hypothetical protein